MLRKRLGRSYAPVVATLALVVATAGGALAAATIGSGDIFDNSVRSADLKNDDVRSKDIRDNSLKSRDVKDDSLKGKDILESSLTGFVTSDEIVSFRTELMFGEAKTVLSVGPVSLVAECRENIPTGDPPTESTLDELRLLGATTQNGAFLQGDTPHSGPGVGSTNLNTDTPAQNRTLGGIVSTAAGDGLPAAEDDIDTGFIASADGAWIGLDETTMYALNVGESDCLLVGVAMVNVP